jgi:hypothetical protein
MNQMNIQRNVKRRWQSQRTTQSTTTDGTTAFTLLRPYYSGSHLTLRIPPFTREHFTRTLYFESELKAIRSKVA